MEKKIIDKKTVLHVALLSRLRLDDKELEAYSRQLESILLYISKLNELDTSTVAPTSHVSSNLENIDRADAVKESLDINGVLANAPDRDDDFFRIPKVIEGK